MKAKEVLKILCISRPTLTKYVKTGVIKATLQTNGDYDYERYDSDDDYAAGVDDAMDEDYEEW